MINTIYSLLSEHQALSEGQIFKLLNISESKMDTEDIVKALAKLYRKRIIEIVNDKTNTMQIYRIKRTLQ